MKQGFKIELRVKKKRAKNNTLLAMQIYRTFVVFTTKHWLSANNVGDTPIFNRRQSY